MIEFISTSFSLAILTYLHQSYCSLANYFQTKMQILSVSIRKNPLNTSIAWIAISR